ncbi:MAG: hypothetical protein KGL39_47785 [Patescibacteria group bacterium]|nr:hypothetical protein [Patescibacteria group bacterium]
MMPLVFEKLDAKVERLPFLGIRPYMQLYRAKVPGGWLVVTVCINGDRAVTFYPDEKHEWDGGSLQ